MPDPAKDAPRSLSKRLTNFGGRNPYGEPNWRVCLSQSCTQICGGIFHTLPDGDLSIVEEGPDGTLYHKAISDTAQHERVMRTPKYPHEGWIMERWFPPHMWGTREWWESQMAEDGITPLMGPYPEKGDYFMLAGPWTECPTISDIETAIQTYNQMQANRPVNLARHMEQQIKDQKEKWTKRREAYVKMLDDRFKSEILPVLKSTSLSAQMVRNQAQEMSGQRGHLGANEIFG